MNERDESLMRYIMASMGENASGPVLFDVNSTQFVRVNLVILKGLLLQKGLSGMFISVDRPHQYMVHLLRMHKINLENIMFIDAIGRFSADRKECMASVGYVDAPFHIDTLPTAISNMGSNGNKKVSLDTCGFAMIDDLAALLPYNSYPSVESFLKSFVGVMTSRGNTIVPLVVDKDKNGLLYETARSLAVQEVDCRTENIPMEAGGTSQVKLSDVRKISDFRYMEGGMH
jgi:hypothetical protein